MKRILLWLWWGALAIPAQGQIILTEVMFNPRGSEQANEFVELYNLSATDTISLAGWRLGEPGALDEIIALKSGLRLPPQHYAVILDPNYFQSSTQYDALMPPQALVFTLADNTFGNGGFSNSVAETVVLVAAAGDTVARYTYSLGNADGVSDEKINLTEDDAAVNWANALRVDGTPGFANSVAPRQIDGALLPASLRIAPLPLREQTKATISVTARNAGQATLQQYTVDFDLLPASREFGAPVYLGNLMAPRALIAADTVVLDFHLADLHPGRYRLLATLSAAADANPTNDTLSIPIAVGWRREALIINEVMFAPASGQPEWLEVFNPQEFSLPLADWLIVDESGSRSTLMPHLEIPPQQYRVLAASPEMAKIWGLADSSIIPLQRLPTLNNSGDAVLLRDFSGALIDSLAYEGDWGESGKSLEKIWFERGNSARNWLPSRASAGATPAARNSVSPRAFNLEMRPLRVAPERPRFGEDLNLEIPVANQGRGSITDFAVQILYDTTDSHNWHAAAALHEFRNDRALAAEDSVSFNLIWEHPPTGHITLAVIVQCSVDEVAQDDSAFSQIEVSFVPGTVVINEVMYDPPAGQPEWIELFNPQRRTVALRGWSLEDATGERTLLNPEASVAPRSYIVVSSSSALAQWFDLPDSMMMVAPRLPALNQNGDMLVLRDANARTLDSLHYENGWGRRGKSLEKIWYEKANLTGNWQPSQAMRGATPAAFNSVSPRDYDLAATALRFSPLRPRAREQTILSAHLRNAGRQISSNFIVRFFSSSERGAESMLLAELPVAQALAAEESMTVELAWPQPPSGKIELAAEVETSQDEVPQNNRITAQLPVGYPARSVIINEIYYAPRSGEVEWFEIFNRGTTPADLSAWLWQDREATAPVVLPDSGIFLQPGEFAVISAPGAIYDLAETTAHVASKWLTLNNDADQIKLFDFNLGEQDSVRFASSWGGATGVSLERINPHLSTQDSSNWSSCVARTGATPGRPNSILTMALPTAATLQVSPNPFSPDADGFEDFALLQINLPVTTAAVRVKIFDLRGRLVRELLNNQPTGSHYEVIWNGHDDRGESVRTGLYLVYLQALRADSGVLLEAKTPVVVARALN